MEKLRNLRDAIKKSSNDFKIGGDTKKKKRRNPSLRHSRSMPLYKFRPADPEYYDRTDKPKYKGRWPLAPSDITLVMDWDKRRPKAANNVSPYQDDTDEELQLRSPSMSPSPSPPPSRPPTPPPKPTPQEMRRAIIDKFPPVPTEMPIPFDLPIAQPPPPRGGKLVLDRQIRPVVYNMASGPASASHPRLLDVLPTPSLDGVPDEDLILTDEEKRARQRMNKLRQEMQDEKANSIRQKLEAEKRARELSHTRYDDHRLPKVPSARQPLHRSTSTNGALTKTLPSKHTEEYKPRPWANPTVFHDEPRPRANVGPGHQRFVSNPTPRSKDADGNLIISDRPLVNTPSEIGYQRQISSPIPLVKPERRHNRFISNPPIPPVITPIPEPPAYEDVENVGEHNVDGYQPRTHPRPFGMPGTRPLQIRRKESSNIGSQATSSSGSTASLRSRAGSNASGRTYVEQAPTPPPREITWVKLTRDQHDGHSNSRPLHGGLPPDPTYYKRSRSDTSQSDYDNRR